MLEHKAAGGGDGKVTVISGTVPNFHSWLFSSGLFMELLSISTMLGKSSVRGLDFFAPSGDGGVTMILGNTPNSHFIGFRRLFSRLTTSSLEDDANFFSSDLEGTGDGGVTMILGTIPNLHPAWVSVKPSSNFSVLLVSEIKDAEEISRISSDPLLSESLITCRKHFSDYFGRREYSS